MAVKVNRSSSADLLELMALGSVAVDVESDRNSALVQLDSCGHGQVRALLARESSRVDQSQGALPRARMLCGTERVEVHSERYLMDRRSCCSGQPCELLMREGGRHDDRVEAADQESVQCGHGRRHADLPAHPKGEHRIQTFMREEQRRYA